MAMPPQMVEKEGIVLGMHAPGILRSVELHDQLRIFLHFMYVAERYLWPCVEIFLSISRPSGVILQRICRAEKL